MLLADDPTHTLESLGNLCPMAQDTPVNETLPQAGVCGCVFLKSILKVCRETE